MSATERQRPARSTTPLLWAMGGMCLVALALALIAQHAFDMRPCPWCVLQRLIAVLLAALLSLAAWTRARGARLVSVGVALALAVAGMVCALYQHLVAAQQFSCNLTLADKVVSALQLDTALPAVFSATASCADAAVSVLGVPFAYWSLGFFSALAAGCLWVLSRRH